MNEQGTPAPDTTPPLPDEEAKELPSEDGEELEGEGGEGGEKYDGGDIPPASEE
jgi:hypothetical protein